MHSRYWPLEVSRDCFWKYNYYIGKTLGMIEGGRRKGQERMRWLEGITDSVDMSVNSRSW